MKKLIALAFTAALAAIAMTVTTATATAADRVDTSALVGTPVGPYDWRVATEAQYREVLDWMLAQTNELNVWLASQTAFTNRSWHVVSLRPDLNDLRLESDTALAARGYGAWWSQLYTFPRLSANSRARYGIDAMVPISLATAAKYGTDINAGQLQRRGATAGELAAVLGELVSMTATQKVAGVWMHDIVGYKKAIQAAAAKNVKRALRMRGVSFVTKDGVNPCESYMTRLTEALNAPRFTGLNEWLADLGVEGRMDLSGLPTEAEVAKLVEDIMYGERNLGGKDKVILYVCLGVDGYNKFVKEYNGG